MPVSDANSRLAAIKNKVGKTWEGGTEAVNSALTAKEKVAEAFRHMGIVVQLLREASSAHNDTQRVIKTGRGPLTGQRSLSTQLYNVLGATGGEETRELLQEAANYQGFYEGVADRAGYIEEGFEADLQAAANLLSDLRGRAGVVEALSSDVAKIAPAATQLMQHIDDRQVR